MPTSTKVVGVALGRVWRPPAIDLNLLTFLTGATFEGADNTVSGRRFRIFDGAAIVVSSVAMVGKTDGVVVIVSADHVIVRVNSAVYAVAANKPMVLTVAGGSASVTIRHGGCRLPVVPAADVAALLDTTGATNVCHRPAAAFPGFVEAVPVSGPKWICPGCHVEHHRLDAMWKHLKAPGPPPLQLRPLMPSPPTWGSPMTFFDENTIATSPGLNNRLHAQLNALAPADQRHQSGDGGRRQHPTTPDCRGDVVVGSTSGHNRRHEQADGGRGGNSNAGGRWKDQERSARGCYGPGGRRGGFRSAGRHNGGDATSGGNNWRDGGNSAGVGPVASHYHGHGKQRHHYAVNRNGYRDDCRAGGGGTFARRGGHQQQRGGGGGENRDWRANASRRGN